MAKELNLKDLHLLSRNPVQQDWIAWFAEKVEHNYDDVYDKANVVAAFKKFTEEIEKRCTESDPEFQEYLGYAMRDWGKPKI